MAPADATPRAVLLVAHADDARRRELATLLVRDGDTVIEAASGQAALERLGARCDLLLVDAHLADVAPSEVAARARHERASLPVVYLWRAGATPTEHTAAESSEVDLVEPVGGAALLATVRVLLRTARAEAALRASRDQLDVILRNVADSILVQDAAGRVVFANEAAVVGLGAGTIDGLLGTAWAHTLSRFELYDEVDQPFPVERLPGRAAVKARAPVEETLRMRPRDGGEERWLIIRSVPIFDEHGEVSLVTSITHDVTARKHTEWALRTIAESSAHDLKNPLSAILMAVPLLERITAKAGLDVTRHLTVIKRAARSMTRLVRDLADVASFNAGQLSIEPSPHVALDVVNEVCDLLAEMAEQRNLTIERQVEGAGDFVMSDRERVLQVLSNLLGNAIKFTPTGGRIVVGARRDGEMVRYSVADTGAGIAPEHVPHVFNRYWRLDPRARGGSGLGLAISKAIVEGHGGRIWIESTPGAGTTVCFTLPVYTPRGG